MCGSVYVVLLKKYHDRKCLLFAKFNNHVAFCAFINKILSSEIFSLELVFHFISWYFKNSKQSVDII